MLKVELVLKVIRVTRVKLVLKVIRVTKDHRVV